MFCDHFVGFYVALVVSRFYIMLWVSLGNVWLGFNEIPGQHSRFQT